MALLGTVKRPAAVPSPLPFWPFLAGVLLGLLFLAATQMPFRWFLLLFLGSLALATSLAFKDQKTYYLTFLTAALPIGVDINIAYHSSTVSHSTYGYLVRLSYIPLIALYGIWFLRCVVDKSPLRFSTTGFWPLSGFVVSAGFSVLSARNFLFGTFDLFALSISILLFVYAASDIREVREIRLVLFVLLSTVAVQGVLALGQHFTGSTLGLEFFGAGRSLQSAAGLETLTRVGGTLGHPNSLALFLDLLLPLSFSLIFCPMKPEAKLLVVASAFLGLAGLTVTLSRGGTIAVGLSLLVILFLRWGSRVGFLRSGIAVVTVSISLLVLVLGTPNPIQTRFLQHDYGTASGRTAHMQVAFNMIRAHPFFGVGLNNYTETAQFYDSTPERIITLWNSPVHNLPLFIAGEIGLIGLGFFLLFLLAILRALLPALRCPDPFLAATGLGLFMGVLAYLLHAQVDYANWSHFNILWFLLGLAVSVGRLAAATANIHTERI
jgi:O-antigen ligase